MPKNFETSFRLSKPRGALPIAGQKSRVRKTPFVVEGDEYDTAFFEKTPKFWHYRPEVAIITSIEHDHIDIYPDAASYEAAFAGFVERVPETGLAVIAAHDPTAVRLAKSAKCETAFYALDGDDMGSAPPHWLACPVASGPEGQTFDLFVGGVAAGRAALPSPGLHNLRNALAALAACCQGYGVSVRDGVRALSTFAGVRRRQDLLYIARGVSVYDDFAHHPTAVRETLAALRAKHASGKLFAVFEPRSATACRSLHQREYETAFASADRVLLSPLGRSDIPSDERLDLDALTSALRKQGTDATSATSVDDIVATLAREAKAGDTIALLSNGAFGGIYEKLRSALG